MKFHLVFSCEPIRCIHDSFIVPAEHEKALKTSMVEYFQEVMKTDYVIGITTETASGKVVDAPVFHSEEKKVVVGMDDGNGNEKGNYKDNKKYFVDLIQDEEWNISVDDVVRLPDEYRDHRFAGMEKVIW